MDYESVGLRPPYRRNYVDRAEHHQTARGLLGFVVRRKATQSETAGASYSNVCDTEGIVWETTEWNI